MLARVQEVAYSNIISLLVELCAGPGGPLAAIDLNSPPPAEEKKKKGKGVKAKKKVPSCCVTLASVLLDVLPQSNHGALLCSM